MLHDGTYANLESPEDVFTVGINRAVDILAEKKAKGFSRPKPGALKDLGPHPAGGGNIQVMSGRYGAYVKFGKVNATLPKGSDPLTLTVEEAVALIAAKSGKEPVLRKQRRRQRRKRRPPRRQPPKKPRRKESRQQRKLQPRKPPNPRRYCPRLPNSEPLAQAAFASYSPTPTT